MSGPRCVSVYGVGHFGYALLRSLDRKAESGELLLRAYDRVDDVRESLRRHRRHPIHDSGRPLPEPVRIVDSVGDLLDGAEVLVLAVTSQSTRDVADRIRGVAWSGPLAIVNTAKALDFQTGRRLSEIVAERLADPPAPYVYAALGGGTIAGDMLQRDPLGVTIGCESGPTLPALRAVFASPQLWVQTTADLAGVEYAGAMKNVIAICAGMVRGMGLSYGSETHLISRMAAEVEDFCVAERACDRATFSVGSQCWGSDLWMSCTGDSRNRALGELIGGGKSLAEATEIMEREHKTVEGVQTLRALGPLLRRFPGVLRLLHAAERVILGDAPARSLVDELMRGVAPAC